MFSLMLWMSLPIASFVFGLRNVKAYSKSCDYSAVHINSMTIHDEPGLPHEGVKSSGWERFNSMNGLKEFLQTKTIT